MKGDQISGVGGFSQNWWQDSYWDQARQAKDRQRQGGDSVRRGLREWSEIWSREYLCQPSGPLLRIPGSPSPLLVLLPTPTPLHTVLFLNSLQWNHVSNGCSLSCQPRTAGPTEPTDLLWGPHEMMCAKQLWKARIKEVIFMIERNPRTVLCPVFKSWTCPFLVVLLEASAYVPQALNFHPTTQRKEFSLL